MHQQSMKHAIFLHFAISFNLQGKCNIFKGLSLTFYIKCPINVILLLSSHFRATAYCTTIQSKIYLFVLKNSCKGNFLFMQDLFIYLFFLIYGNFQNLLFQYFSSSIYFMNSTHFNIYISASISPSFSSPVIFSYISNPNVSFRPLQKKNFLSSFDNKFPFTLRYS